MKRVLAFSLALSALSSIGCGAHVSAVVQVYDGQLQSVQTPATALADLHKAEFVLEEKHAALLVPVEKVQAAIGELDAKISEAAKTLADIEKDPEYGKSFESYRGAWEQYAKAVNEASGGNGGEQAFTKDKVKAAIEDLRAVLGGTINRKSKRVLRVPFQDALATASGKDKATLAVLSKLVCWGGAAPCTGVLGDEERAILKSASFKDSVGRLAKSVKDAKAPSPLVLTGQKNAEEALRDMKADVDRVKKALEAQPLADAWKDVKQSLTAAEAALSAARAEPGASTQAVTQKAQDATAIAQARIRAYADALEAIRADAKGAVEKIVQKGDLSLATQFVAGDAVAPLIEERPNVTDVDVKAYLEAIPVKLGESVKSIRVSAGLVGKPGFDATDSNVAKLDDEKWKDPPVDSVEVRADGDSDFVIVQESPTRFSVKQLRFDPKSNAQLGVSVADLGLDIATTVLAQTTGVNLDLSSGSSSGAADGGNTGDARKRIADDCRASLRAMSTSLEAEIARIPGEGKALEPELVGRIRGLLRGHHALLSACKTALGNVPASSEGSTGQGGNAK